MLVAFSRRARLQHQNVIVCAMHHVGSLLHREEQATWPPPRAAAAARSAEASQRCSQAPWLPATWLRPQPSCSLDAQLQRGCHSTPAQHYMFQTCAATKTAAPPVQPLPDTNDQSRPNTARPPHNTARLPPNTARLPPNRPGRDHGTPAAVDTELSATVAPHVSRAITAAGTGGAEAEEALMQALRGERSLPAFLAAVQTLPKGSPVVWKLLDLLGTVAAAGDTWLRPTYRVATALLDRAERDELGSRVDNVIQQLRSAGLRMHYSLWLRWAGCHVATGSVQGVRRVMRLLEEAEGPAALTAHFYVFLTKAYCHRGRWKEAEQLPEEMRQRGMPPSEHVYRAVIWCCGRHHRADRAQRMFGSMLAAGLSPSMETWSALLNAYAESRQPRGAVQALRGMRRAGFEPSVKVYGALTKAFARSGDLSRTLQVLELMQAGGVAPNEQVFGSAIEAAATAGKPGVAAELLERMREAGCPPNVVAFTSLLSAYGAAGDAAAAEGVLRRMQAAGCPPNSRTYTELMSHLLALGLHDKCQAYFEEMQAAGLPIDHVSTALLLDSLLDRWAADQEGQPELLRAAAERWRAASAPGGVLAPHTFLHQPQGRLCLDLHGCSGWTGQLAVLSTLDGLLRQHADQPGSSCGITRLDVIVGRGNRSLRRKRGVLREPVLRLLQNLVPVSFGRANEGLLVVEGRHLRMLFDIMLTENRTFAIDSMQRCLVNPKSCA